MIPSVNRILSRFLPATLAASLLTSPASALEGGTEIFDSSAVNTFSLHSNQQQTQSSSSTVTVKEQPFNKALQVKIGRRPEREWNVTFSNTIHEPLRKGDVMLAEVWIRSAKPSPENGFSKVSIVLQDPAYNTLGRITSYLTDEWTKLYIHCLAEQNYAPGEVTFALFLGHYAQTLEIGPITLTNYGNSMDSGQLPINRISYAGQESDAPWRAEAAERIEKIRKSDLEIQVTDKSGRPVKQADVKIEMKRHAFYFGTAITAKHLLREDDNGEQYRKWIDKLFNMVCFGNEMKWRAWNGYGFGEQYTSTMRTNTLRSIAWLNEHDIALRGHTTMWWKSTPDEVKALEGEALSKALNQHVDSFTRRFAGQCKIWDLHSEPIAEPVFQEHLGMAEVAGWFRLAHAADPQAMLFVNEYDLVSLDNPLKMKKFIQYIQELEQENAPLHGISPQCTFYGLEPISLVKQRLDELAKLDYVLFPDQWAAIISDEEAQARYVRDFYTLLFSHPAAIGVTHWGFWEDDMWKPEAAWFRSDWSIKPCGQAFIDLVLNEWWTREQGSTDASGRFSARGFHGDYEITVRTGDLEKTVTCPLPADGNRITVILD